MTEEINFKPEDLVETSGENIGNYKQEIAEIGGQASYDYSRDEFDTSKEASGRKDKWKQGPYSEVTALDTPKERANAVGDIAMEEEVRERARAYAKSQGRSPEAQDRFAEAAVNNFRNEHRFLTKERVERELKALYDETGIREKNHL